MAGILAEVLCDVSGGGKDRNTEAVRKLQISGFVDPAALQMMSYCSW